MARPLNITMGRQRIGGSVAYGGSQSALRDQFNASMGNVLHNLGVFIRHMHDVGPEILEEALRPTFGKSQVYCPVQDGNLRASGYVESKRTSEGAEAEIGYGRGGLPGYAIYVHELPAAHEEPTRDKFLQAALDEDYFAIINRIPLLVREAAGT
jgi:hypothetical protein